MPGQTVASFLLMLVKMAPGSCSTAVVFLCQVLLHSPAHFCSQDCSWDCALALATKHQQVFPAVWSTSVWLHIDG